MNKPVAGFSVMEMVMGSLSASVTAKSYTSVLAGTGVFTSRVLESIGRTKEGMFP